MRKRFLNLTLALGLVVGLLAGAVGSAGATTTYDSNVDWLFFPWVPNGEELDGEGEWYGSVTIQNLENFPIRIDFSNTAGGNIGTGQMTTLEPHASKSFSAANLGLPDGGAGVAVRASWYSDANGTVEPEDCRDREGLTETVERGDQADGQDALASQGIIRVDSVIDENGTVYDKDEDWVYVNGAISWQPAGAEPSAGTSYDVTMTILDCDRAPRIGGIEKQVNVGSSSFTVNTTNDSIVSVDGYTAIPDEDVAWGSTSSFCHDAVNDVCNNLGVGVIGLNLFGNDGRSYLPIVQTNNGWNSVLHITNIDASSPDYAAVNVRFYASGDETYAGSEPKVWDGLVNKGGSVTIDVKEDVGLPDDWVGSAEITSDYGVVTNVSRVKNVTDMLMTNTAAPSMLAATSTTDLGGPYWEMYAPLVFKHYNGWNTGINIVNLAEVTNTVSIEAHGPTNNVMSFGSVTLAPKESKFLYIPSSGDAGLTDEFHGAAILKGVGPFHAAIDEVKYHGSDNFVGHAMSYTATRAGAAENRESDTLSLPLVQKGSQSTGMGDTSGIDLFNGDSDDDVTVEINFFNPSGSLSTFSINSPLSLTLGALNTATVYTMNGQAPGVVGLGNMESPFRGSATVQAVEDSGDVYGVSNNVNYAVEGDGSAVYNLFNSYGSFRNECSQLDCDNILGGQVGGQEG